ARHLVEAGGLDRVALRLREAGLDAGHDARGKPPAAAVDEERVGLCAGLLELLGDLETHGALAGHDLGIVEGQHQGHAALLDYAAADRLAVVALAVEEHDLGAPPAAAPDLDRRRVPRHHADPRAP